MNIRRSVLFPPICGPQTDARDGERRRRAPLPFARPASRHARPVPAADDERFLHELWNHRDTFRAFENLFRDAFVGRSRTHILDGLGHLLQLRRSAFTLFVCV